MIELVTRLKAAHGLKVTVVSNEARELNAYRIRQFKLAEFVDFFVSSCFVRMRKPDADMFRLALDLAQVEAANVVYIDNTPMFVQIAANLGIRGIVHTDRQATRAQLATLGLVADPAGAKLKPNLRRRLPPTDGLTNTRSNFGRRREFAS